MFGQGFTGIIAWVEKLNPDTMLAFLVGCPLDTLPPPGSYYDFIDRLCSRITSSRSLAGKAFFLQAKTGDPPISLEKGKTS